MKTFHQWLIAASLVLATAVVPQRTAWADECGKPCWVCCPWKYSPTSCVSTINGPCFGYYPTCWRSWSEACPPCPAPDPANALSGFESMHEMIPTPMDTAPDGTLLEPTAPTAPAPVDVAPPEVVPMSATEPHPGAFKYSILDIFSPPPSVAARAHSVVGGAVPQRTAATATPQRTAAAPTRTAYRSWATAATTTRTASTASRGTVAGRKVAPRTTVVVGSNSESRTATQTYAHAPLGFTEKAKPQVYSSLPVFFQKR